MELVFFGVVFVILGLCYLHTQKLEIKKLTLVQQCNLYILYLLIFSLLTKSSAGGTWRVYDKQIVNCILRERVITGNGVLPRISLIARLMGPTWGPSGADRTQVGSMLAPWTLLSGKRAFCVRKNNEQMKILLCQEKQWTNEKPFTAINVDVH